MDTLNKNTYKKIGIVVVLYGLSKINIDIKTLPGHSVLIIVDNTPNQNLRLDSKQNLQYIPLGQNKGIAEAQNIGIKKACELGCTHIVFFDQDSIIPGHYVEHIVQEYERIQLKQPKLFLLGPVIFNGRNGIEYKSNIHSDDKTDYNFIPRREIISSGACISLNKIKDIGTLESKLFIDYVDFEWCWRANSKGFISGVTPNVTLTHFVGQQEYYVLRQLIIISSPIRYYYQTRNYLWLLRYSHVPLSWKINTLIKRFLFTITYPFKVKEWKSIYYNILKGITAGLKFRQHD